MTEYEKWREDISYYLEKSKPNKGVEKELATALKMLDIAMGAMRAIEKGKQYPDGIVEEALDQINKIAGGD